MFFWVLFVGSWLLGGIVAVCFFCIAGSVVINPLTCVWAFFSLSICVCLCLSVSVCVILGFVRVVFSFFSLQLPGSEVNWRVIFLFQKFDVTRVLSVVCSLYSLYAMGVVHVLTVSHHLSPFLQVTLPFFITSEVR